MFLIQTSFELFFSIMEVSLANYLNCSSSIDFANETSLTNKTCFRLLVTHTFEVSDRHLSVLFIRQARSPHQKRQLAQVPASHRTIPQPP